MRSSGCNGPPRRRGTMDEPVRDFVIGTAGHIDHGKTALVRALTGVDTDRLPAEKQRRDHDRPGLRVAVGGRVSPGDGRRPRPRAVHPQHAGRGVRAGPGHADRRRRRLGHAPDSRAPGDPAAPRPLGRRRGRDQVRPRRAGLDRHGRGRHPLAGPEIVPGGGGDRPHLGHDRPGDRRAEAVARGPLLAGASGRGCRPVPDGDRPRLHRGRARYRRDGDRRLRERGGRRRARLAAGRQAGAGARAPSSRPPRRAGRPRVAGGDQPGRRASRRGPPWRRAGRPGIPGSLADPDARDRRIARGHPAPAAPGPLQVPHRDGRGLVRPLAPRLRRIVPGPRASGAGLPGRAGGGGPRPAVRPARREPAGDDRRRPGAPAFGPPVSPARSRGHPAHAVAPRGRARRSRAGGARLPGPHAVDRAPARRDRGGVDRGPRGRR